MAGREAGVETCPRPLKPFFRLAVFGERPAGKHHRVPGPKRKHLLCREGKSPLRPLQAKRQLAAGLMNARRKHQGKSFAEGVRGSAGRGDPFLSVPKSLVGKALLAEHNAQLGVASHARVLPETGRFDAVALGIVKHEALLQVPARRSELTHKRTDITHSEGG